MLFKLILAAAISKRGQEILIELYKKYVHNQTPGFCTKLAENRRRNLAREAGRYRKDYNR